MDIVAETGHSTVIVTDDGTSSGKFLGIVTNKDYRPSKDDRNAPIDILLYVFLLYKPLLLAPQLTEHHK